jgi:hypothetical protein
MNTRTRSAAQNKKKLRTAILGAGFMGRLHIEGVRRLGTVEVAAVVSVDG